MQKEQSERWLIVEAGMYLLYAKVATLTTSARTLLALGGTSAAPARPSPELPQEIWNAVSAIEHGRVYLGFTNCLVRAVALRMLLGRRDVVTELHIGARRDEQGEFAAHAWLTYHDTILIGGEDATVIYREVVGSGHSVLQ